MATAIAVPQLPQAEVVYGGMGCGKTTELIRRVRRHRIAKRRVLLANHKSDIRYASGKVISHDKDSEDAHMIGSLQELSDELLTSHDVLAVDEAQFFDNLYDDVLSISSRYPNLRFILAGLTLYSNGLPFGDLCQFLPWAECTQLFAVCIFCNSERATMTACNKIKDADVTVGASEVGYFAACTKCWARNTKS